MPWINEEDCVGCGVCVENCPVGIISLKNSVATIDMVNCIHCGICRDTCPISAVRHDSEKIPDEVKSNVTKTKEYMDACAKYLGDSKEKQNVLIE